jgi:hypothetical protein
MPEPLSILVDTLATLRAGLAGDQRAHYFDALAGWSAVHGLAMLLISGSLVDAPESVRTELTNNVLRMVRSGLENSEHPLPTVNRDARV